MLYFLFNCEGQQLDRCLLGNQLCTSDCFGLDCESCKQGRISVSDKRKDDFELLLHLLLGYQIVLAHRASTHLRRFQICGIQKQLVKAWDFLALCAVLLKDIHVARFIFPYRKQCCTLHCHLLSLDYAHLARLCWCSYLAIRIRF